MHGQNQTARIPKLEPILLPFSRKLNQAIGLIKARQNIKLNDVIHNVASN